jgi:uncharacterized protein (DUF2384 family)
MRRKSYLGVLPLEERLLSIAGVLDQIVQLANEQDENLMKEREVSANVHCRRRRSPLRSGFSRICGRG